MQIEVIPQACVGSIPSIRIGDFLNREISQESCTAFKFAVAFMRLSGLNRLAPSIDSLLNRSGLIAGAVGVDDKVTSVEALEALANYSTNSTVFYTTSNIIYHPKLYLIYADRFGIAVVGSGNLTRDGLFRNIEFASAIFLDFENRTDYEIFQRYDLFITEFLNIENPNIKRITPEVISTLERAGIIKKENQTEEFSRKISQPRNSDQITSRALTDIADLFPTVRIPTAPPGLSPLNRAAPSRPLVTPIVVPPATIGNVDTFIMQLSAFDSSHRTGIPGTTEVLIPLEAQSFFPPLTTSPGRAYPDANFDVFLNTLFGPERHNFRVWSYDKRSEFRLRMDHDTIDLTTPGGGDLLVINKLPEGSDPLYEVTILPQTDPTFPAFYSFCGNESNGKRWGMGRF